MQKKVADCRDFKFGIEGLTLITIQRFDRIRRELELQLEYLFILRVQDT